MVETEKGHLTNWSGNIRYRAGNFHYPRTVEEVQAIVRQCDRITCLGSRHSFNRIADNEDNLLSLKEMNKVLTLDSHTRTVTIEGGARYGEFVGHLHEHGYALPNLASLPHITVVGACTTATHGSGVLNGNLSTSVSEIEFVDAKGNVVNLSKRKDGEEFYGAVVGLGALGVVTKVTLDLLPTFDMQQVVYRNLPMSALKDNFYNILSRGYSVSLFTDWKNKNINEVWIKSKVGNENTPDVELYGAKLATEKLHPIEGLSAENVTDQMGIPGPWYERMPHFRMNFTPSAGKELQSEYFVPLEHAYQAMMALEKIKDEIAPYIFISEIRTINADNFWMSPCYKRVSVAFHTTWKQEIEAVMGLLPLMEEQLAPFDPIPHWGKLFTMTPPVLQSKYERLGDFKNLIAKYDGRKKFQNDFLKTYLGGK
jgi:alditol oxidase